MKLLLWLLFALSLLTFSLNASWQLSKSANFFYVFWYQSLQIDLTIKKHVAINTHGKQDFPIEDVNLHQKKFAEIVQAVHQQGVGLEQISYKNFEGKTRRLLTNSEIIHLQDVANLLDKVSQLSTANLAVLLLFFIIYTRDQGNKNKLLDTRPKDTRLIENKASKADVATTSIIAMPSNVQKIIAVILLCLLIIIILSLWGFTSVFYYLHTVIFPADHQWFFYYHESLMATIMKAPDIFSAIAAQLLVVALLLATGIDAIFTRLQRSK